MNTVGRHLLQEQPVNPAEYLYYLIKTAQRVKQLNLIQQYFKENIKARFIKNRLPRWFSSQLIFQGKLMPF